MIVEKNVVLSGISIKPPVLSFEIWIRIIFSRVMGFSNTRRSVDPDSSDLVVSVGDIGV